MYLKLCVNICVSNFDFAITYNNMSRIYFYLDEFSAAYQNGKMSYDYFKIEINKIVKNKFITENRNTRSNIELISFLYYNFAILLEKVGKVEESQIAFKKGYEFSVSFLGEFHINTNKFPSRITKVFNDVVVKTCSMNDTVITSTDSNCSIQFSRIRKSSTSQKRFMRRDYSFDETIKSKIGDVTDLRLKMDMLIKKVDKFDNFEKTLNEVMRSKSRDNIELKKDGKKVGLKNDKLLRYLKTDVNKLVKSFSSNNMDETSVRSQHENSKSVSKEELYLNEFVNQLELDEKKVKFTPNLPPIERGARDGGSPKRSSHTVSIVEHQASNKRQLKDMFSKVIGEYKPKKPEGRFSEMIRELGYDIADKSPDRSPDKSPPLSRSTINYNDNMKRGTDTTITIDSSAEKSRKTSLKEEAKKEFKINLNNEDTTTAIPRNPSIKPYVIIVDQDSSGDTYKSNTFYTKDQEHLTNEHLYKRYNVHNIIEYQTYTEYNNSKKY
jgi:hypothetical protein